ncbi:ANTAR domain-containing protein [Streptomyces sp. NBC_01622]|uniref:ANTAR domain-containing protein n=1 Tax=Streptomyces sp. NBC_01622 TaxID=2975903 RepID=UPI0038653CEA|nr:ANTAR domain-containing protein [Streptomyces sp. NBC_01622]
MSEPASTTHPAAGYGTAFPEPVPPWGGPERSLPGIEAHPAGDGTLVAVSGALDLLTEQALYDALHEVLGRSVRGIDLDLSGIDFCDCAGLNALLRVRRQARDEDRTVAVRNASAVVHRLLSVTRTRPLFTVVDENHLSTRQLPDASSGPIPHRWKESVSLGEAHHDPRIELVQLRRAMQTRPVIDLARGALMASFGLSPEQAWEVLVTVSQNTNTKLHHVAEEIVGAVTGPPLSEVVQQQLAATVAALPRTPSAAPEAEAGEA